MRQIILALFIILSTSPMYSQEDSSERIELSGSQNAVAKTTDAFAIALPVATLAGVLITRDWEGLKEGVFTAAATTAATMILKYSIKERRPDNSNFHSFPSGHTAVTFATASFLQRRYGWKFGVPAYALAGYVGWGRVYSKKHHWWDVVAGGAIGAASAFIFTKPFAKEHNLQISPTTDGKTMALYISFDL